MIMLGKIPREHVAGEKKYLDICTMIPAVAQDEDDQICFNTSLTREPPCKDKVRLTDQLSNKLGIAVCLGEPSISWQRHTCGRVGSGEACSSSSSKGGGRLRQRRAR